MLTISDSVVIEHDWTMNYSILLHNFDILSVILWAIEKKPSRGFALVVLLTRNWDYLWLLILIKKQNNLTKY